MSPSLFRWVFVGVIKMLQYDRTDVLEGIDINKASESKECMLYQNWYF